MVISANSQLVSQKTNSLNTNKINHIKIRLRRLRWVEETRVTSESREW